ncbi:Respiratory supercomplex factor 1, mitochondrial [Cryptotrichosporon argae]
MTTPISSQPTGEMTYFQHGWQKCKQQPLVPIGAAATTAALLGATASLRSGNRKSFQVFLRARVVAQGLTVVAMVVGAYALTNKPENAAAGRDRAIRGQLPPEPPATIPDADVRPQDEYPARERVKVSDFTRRLREAEALDKEQRRP